MMVPEGSYTGQLVPPTALALDLSDVLSKGEGRIPSAMEIYDRIADLRCRLDVPATIDSDTYHGYSYRNWPQQQQRETPIERRPATARSERSKRMLSARRLRPSSSKSVGVIATHREGSRDRPPIPRIQSAPTYKPVGDFNVRHKNATDDIWKRNAWGQDGRLTPLTIEAMERKGVLPEELKPVPKPEPDEINCVTALRYQFLARERCDVEWAVLDERNKLAQLKSARAGSQSAIAAVFERFAASKDTSQNLQNSAARATMMDFNEFLRCLRAMKLVPEPLSVDDATDFFNEAVDSTREMSADVFYSTLRSILHCVAEREISSEEEGAMQSQRSLGGKTVEAEISKKRIALAHLKEVEERRLALEFQHEIDLNTRRNEILEKIQRSNARTAKVQQENKLRLSLQIQAARERHQELMAEVVRKRVEDEELAAQHARNKAARDALQREEREKRAAEEKATKKELRQLQHEALQRRRLRTERSDLYRRDQLYQCIQKKGRRKGEIEALKETLVEQRRVMAQDWGHRHVMLQEIKAEVSYRGTIKHKAVPKELQEFEILNNFAQPNIVAHMENRDPEAVKLTAGEFVHGSLLVGQYHDYRLWVPVDMARCMVRIQLKANRGDTDLYVGNGECPQPRKAVAEHTWRKAEFGDDKLIINYFDPKFTYGWCYITVYAQSAIDSECEYSLKAKIQPVRD